MDDSLPPYAEPEPLLDHVPPVRQRRSLGGITWVFLATALLVSYALILLVIGAVAVHDGLQDRDTRLAQAATHYDRGVIYMDQGNYAEAAGEFELAVDLAPSYLDARTQLAKARERAKRETDAVSLLEQGETAYRQGQWEQAIHYLEQVRTLNPDYEQEKVENLLFFAYYNKGLQLVAADQVQEALTQFDLALTIRPAHPDVMQQKQLAQSYLEGRNREAVSDWTGALRSYEAVQQVNPNYRDVYQRLYDVRVRYGDQLLGAGSACAAHEQYKLAVEMGLTGGADAKQSVAWSQCVQAQTPVPTSIPVAPPARTVRPGFYVGELAETYDTPGSIQIRGYVRDRYGKGVPGVVVVITIFDFQEARGTDANGYFSFDGIVSPYQATLKLRDEPCRPLEVKLEFGKGFVIYFQEGT
ncbi:MAG: tetratricopeptide repeat protein [Chloroflexi bacterium]|nr:tetratricopeptide repeat protein [Chloroflexota bacterium]MBU1747495.1 tetratricopeptide repeat protein [Chloroflexota bacterium]